MNPSIKNLYKIAQKERKTIIGLMSGTSLDGLDIALCDITGDGKSTAVELLNFKTIPYEPQFKNRLKAITSVPHVSMEEVTLLHAHLGNYHGQLISDQLKQWGLRSSNIDCVASHGQTIYHAPSIQHGQPEMPNATLQIGDGDHLARQTGILTISDFRQKHTAAGGEGAPMASFVDEMIYSHDSKDRLLLNIGGIANFTYLPARNKENRVPITTDTGPGNTLIDAAMHRYFVKEYDKDGLVAQKGSINEQALKSLKRDTYFQKPLPKTTGPEVFNLEWVDRQLANLELSALPKDNLIATLTRLSAETIAEAINKVIHNNPAPAIYVSGGGYHNPILMKWLRELLPNCPINTFEEIGCNPDAKEAVLFAVLANEMLSGKGFPISPQKDERLNFGKISFPD